MSSSDSDSDDESFKFKPSFVQILVDTEESMFERSQHQNSRFEWVMEALAHVGESLVLETNRRAWNNFILTTTSNNSETAKVLDSIEDLVKGVKTLKMILQEDLENLKRRFIKPKDFDFSGFLADAKRRFNSVKEGHFRQTLLLITNGVSPVEDKVTREKIMNLAHDFKINEIGFVVIVLSEVYNFEFYYELLTVARGDDSAEQLHCWDAEGLQKKLNTFIKTPLTKQRIRFFPLKDELTRFMNIEKISLIKSKKVLCNSKVDEAGVSAPKASYTRSQKDCWEVSLPPPEANVHLNNFVPKNYKFPVGYTFLYFNKRSTEVGIHDSRPFYVKGDNDDDLIVNYNTLWQYCVDKNVVAVCMARTRSNSKPKPVEFIPKNVNKTRVFYVFNIEPSHGILQYKPEPPQKIDENKINLLQSLINELTFDYKTDMFVDVALAKTEEYIRASLLDEEEDTSNLDVEEAPLSQALVNITDELKEFFDEPRATNKKRKRP